LGRRVAILGLAATLLGGGGTASAAVVADAGALKARVGSERWRLELVDRDRRPVLAEDPAIGAEAAGTLGFRTAAGWRHATKVASSRRAGDGYRAVLETTDSARTIEVRLEPAGGGGVISLDARIEGPLEGMEAIGIGFRAHPGERYLGFGERSNRAEQGGGVVESYVADGPYQAEEYPLINAFVPRWGLRDDRPDASYFPVPWLLSTAGYGVLVDNPETSYFRLRSERADAWSVEVVPAPAGESGAAGAPPVDRLRLRFLRRPRAGQGAEAVHPRDRPPARGGAVGAGHLVPGRRGRGGRGRAPARGRRAALGVADLRPLSALRRPGRPTPGRAHGARACRGGRDHHLLQSDDLRRLPTRLRRGGRRRGADRRRRG
jgi:hypothetical protein